MRLVTFLKFILLFSLSNLAIADSGKWTSVREAVLEKDFKRAQDKLNRLGDESLNTTEQATKYFALGYLAFTQKRWSDAKTALEKSLQLKTPLADLASYYLGLSNKELQDFKEAQKNFDKALSEKPPHYIEREIKYSRGEILILQKKWKDAKKEFVSLERKWRGDSRYPFVLWQLVGIELNLRAKGQACEWMRKLYEKYPEHQLTSDWSLQLEDATYNGEKLLCTASLNNQKKRIRTLQARGLSSKARHEIDELSESREKLSAFFKDTLLSDFYVNDGYPSEAVNILLKYYADNLRNYDYLMLLGRAAARSGNYPVAIAAYTKAADLAKGKNAQQAEFQAAFLTYQYQDYDGATRKFHEFIKRFSGSALARDAKWYLAWVQYLRQDYDSALKGIREIITLAQKSKKLWAEFPVIKLRYWEAMTLFRKGRFEESANIFYDLSRDRSQEFYAIASQERLRDLDTHLPSPIGSKEGKPTDIASNEPKLAAPVPLLPGPEATPDKDSAKEPNSIDANESASEAELEEDMIEQATGPTEEGLEGEDAEAKVVLNIRDPRLGRWFDRARDLIQVGFNEMAEKQLQEIETHTSNSSYLKTVLGAYQSIQSYYRSAYMGEIQFGFDRRRFGMTGVRYLWEAAFPRAYDKYVGFAGGKSSVAEELIWAIMRAESFYRPQIVSPVGAMGLMQVMPYTARQVAFLGGEKSFQEQSLFDPSTNIKISAQYLARLNKIFDSQVPLVAAAYNAGPHRVESWLATFGRLEMDEFIEHIPFFETRNYAKKVTRNFLVYNRLYSKKQILVKWLAEPIKGANDRTFKERETWETL